MEKDFIFMVMTSVGISLVCLLYVNKCRFAFSFLHKVLTL